MSAFDILAASTVIVVDTADLDLLSCWDARDATTNPSLIRKAAADPRDAHLVRTVVRNIRCNLILLFSFTQAQACAAAGVQWISLLVSRIADWYRLWAGTAWDAEKHRGASDQGVQAARIWRYDKQQRVPTEVMARKIATRLHCARPPLRRTCKKTSWPLQNCKKAFACSAQTLR